MKNILLSFGLLCIAFLSAPEGLLAQDASLQPDYQELARLPGAVTFTPPLGWQVADSKQLTSSVKIMVVGKGQREFPPSINLVTEPFKGTLKDYLRTVKTFNEKEGADWKDLGTIQTDAGVASLSQVDFKSQWGEVREMHVILLKDDMIYLLTAAALKEEFPKYYKDFFRSLRSLKINPEQEIDRRENIS